MSAEAAYYRRIISAIKHDAESECKVRHLVDSALARYPKKRKAKRK